MADDSRLSAPPVAGAHAGDGRPNVPEWAKLLVKLTDDLIEIPGTDKRFGLDALIGLLPGAGDSAMAVIALSLVALAASRRVPLPVLLRMVANVAIDMLGGSVPVLGDVFDAAFGANRRNLALLEEHQYEAKPPGALDYALTGGLVLVGIGLILLPIAVLGLVGGGLVQLLGG